MARTQTPKVQFSLGDVRRRNMGARVEMTHSHIGFLQLNYGRIFHMCILCHILLVYQYT